MRQKILNFGIFVHLPCSKLNHTKSNILNELKLIYSLSLNIFQLFL